MGRNTESARATKDAHPRNQEAQAMRVLVCGGRNFDQVAFLYSTLDKLHKEREITTLIEGDARGADRIAGVWARSLDIPLEVFPANWDKHGRAAGPIRNQQMLDEGKPDLVVAFPGGRGTANMVQLAKDRGVEVIEVCT